MLTQTASVEAIAAPPCTDRPLSYYISTGKYYYSLQQSLLEAADGNYEALEKAKGAWAELMARSHPTSALAPCLQMLERWVDSLPESKEAIKEAKRAWNEFLKNSGLGSFIKHCLGMLKQWQSLPETLQNELVAIPFPTYLPCTSALNLLKVPADDFSGCLARLRDLAGEQGYLLPKDVTAIAKLFHVRKVTCLIPEEIMVEAGWTFIAKKYKFNPEKLAEIKQRSEQLATANGGTVFVDDVLQVLEDKGYDTSRILPKKKQDEVEALKAQLAILERQVAELQKEVIVSEAIVEKPVEETVETPVEIPQKEKVVPSEPADSSEPLPLVTSLKDLKGYPAIALFNGVWKSGELLNQIGIERSVYFRKAEDKKLYPREFSEVQVEFPSGGDRFYPLDELIEENGWTVEEEKAELSDWESELRKDRAKKADRANQAKRSKGFGYSDPVFPVRSNQSQGFKPMAKKAGMR